MTIKVYFKNDYVTTKINGELKEIAEYYFKNPDVERIELLDGFMWETEYVKNTPLEIYRVSDEEVKEFELWNNIRLKYSVHSKINAFKDYVSSCGLCNVA